MTPNPSGPNKCGGVARERRRWLLALSFVVCGGPALAQTCTADDKDCDGIPDHLERILLDRFRPYLRFSRDSGSGETFRPTDVADYLRVSEIDGTGSEGERVLLSNSDLRTNPLRSLQLNVNDARRYCSKLAQCSSDITLNARRTDYHINPDNDRGRRGNDWSVVMNSKRVGLYGHVVPIRLARAEDFSRNAVQSNSDLGKSLFYKIEYWQFFGYSSNDKPGDVGDHEGDWDTVQLIVEPGNPALNRPARWLTILHYAHGKELRFDRSAVVGEPIQVDARTIELHGNAYGAEVPDLHDDSFSEAKARNHAVQMYWDETSKAYEHPVVYVEHGGHEFWPTKDWSMYGAQNHGGDDTEHSYLSNPPPNLGEVEHPLNEDPVGPVILRFNGYWGTYSKALPGIFSNNPPPGPPLHYQWTWPVDSSIRWQLKNDRSPKETPRDMEY